MNVDYTGRQFDITPKIRKEVEAGLAKLVKIVGENCSCKVILTAEKQRRIAEITVTRRTKKLVGHGEATDVLVAIDEALELAKKFGAEDSKDFINGILDRVLRDYYEKAGQKES